MTRSAAVDIAGLSYDQWLTTVFDHEPPSDSRDERWFWAADLQVSSPAPVLENFTRTCAGFQDVVRQFSLPQIDQGIWLLLGPRLRVSQYLFVPSIPRALRTRCVQSMYSVFADFVATSTVDEMENCFYMWWELVLLGEPRQPELPDERAVVRREILDVLLRILALPDSRCQTYALHGMGHLGDSGSREAVATWIEQHRHELDDAAIRWAESCRDGTVQ